MDRLFGFLHESEDTLSLGVDLNGFKNNLGQENSVRGIIQLLPVCTTADLAGLLSLLGGEKNLPLCRFPDEVMGLVYPIIQPFILNMVAQIPDQIPLITLSLQSPNTPSRIGDLRKSCAQFKYDIQYSYRVKHSTFNRPGSGFNPGMEN